MAYLNLGCGSTFNRDWVNVDYSSMDKDVIQCNLLNGIPFEDAKFEAVYHSHVLEHFTKQQGEKFISECYRVLAKNGIIRIAVPNLEEIVNNYLIFLKKGLEEPENLENIAHYNWTMLELYDQALRNSTGGEMLKYLLQDTLPNKNFIIERIGGEGRVIIDNKNTLKALTENRKITTRKILSFFKSPLLYISLVLLGPQGRKYYNIGKFRMSGENHLWMYDRLSLTKLLKEAGFSDIIVQDASKSMIPFWENFNLDGKNGEVRKPDSIFIEAKKYV